MDGVGATAIATIIANAAAAFKHTTEANKHTAEHLHAATRLKMKLIFFVQVSISTI